MSSNLYCFLMSSNLYCFFMSSNLYCHECIQDTRLQYSKSFLNYYKKIIELRALKPHIYL